MKISMNVAPSTVHGWGVYAMNVLLGLAGDSEVEIGCPYPAPETLLVDPMRLAKMVPAFGQFANGADVYLHAVGNDFDAEPGTPRDRTIAWAFFEAATEKVVERAARYPMIIVGCSWQERILRDAGINHVRMIHQGCDRTLFHPGPRLGLFDGKFAIFSGGKAEHRKGQDIVLAAFREFARTNPDALLVTAWHSPFSWCAKTCDASGLAAPVRYRGPAGTLPRDAPYRMHSHSSIDVKQWAVDTGINPDQVVDLGQVHHTLMPQVYRECDAAVFPNRIELSQNLVACEALSCGLPIAAMEGTGHRDLFGPHNSQYIDRIYQHDPVQSTIAAMEGFRRKTYKTPVLAGFSWRQTCYDLKAACREVDNA